MKLFIIINEIEKAIKDSNSSMYVYVGNARSRWKGYGRRTHRGVTSQATVRQEEERGDAARPGEEDDADAARPRRGVSAITPYTVPLALCQY